jgi:hypothetical protein
VTHTQCRGQQSHMEEHGTAGSALHIPPNGAYTPLCLCNTLPNCEHPQHMEKTMYMNSKTQFTSLHMVHHTLAHVCPKQHPHSITHLAAQSLARPAAVWSPGPSSPLRGGSAGMTQPTQPCGGRGRETQHNRWVGVGEGQEGGETACLLVGGLGGVCVCGGGNHGMFVGWGGGTTKSSGQHHPQSQTGPRTPPPTPHPVKTSALGLQTLWVDAIPMCMHFGGFSTVF